MKTMIFGKHRTGIEVNRDIKKNGDGKILKIK